MPKIRKAVITAAGSGSRLLPFSKETPKEMLPYCARARDGRLILKPILEVVYESLHDHGYRKFCFVVGRGKRSIEDYFLIDDSAKYSTNSDLQDFYKRIRSSHIMYVQQSSPRGFGDAVLKAKLFAGKDSFLLHAGDDVILSPGNGHIQRLEDAFFSNGADIALLVDRVERPEQYGVIEGRGIGDGLFRVEHLEEKPRRPKDESGSHCNIHLQALDLLRIGKGRARQERGDPAHRRDRVVGCKRQMRCGGVGGSQRSG